MRTGKTKSIIDTACLLYGAGEIDRVLVIAPNGVHSMWADRELLRHHWDKVSYEAYVWVSSQNNEIGLCIGRKGLVWFMVNMESLILERAQKSITRFMKGGRTLVVFDESHHFAVPGAKRTAIARGIARKATYSRILSGTSSENSPLQLWSQYELLHKACLGHETFGSFKDEYAVWEMGYGGGGRRFPKLKGYRGLEQLKARMAPFSSVVLRSDCEDLPPVQIDQRRVELDPVQLKWWKQCKKNELQFLEDRGQQEALTGGAALFKLQQIEGGFWKNADGYEKVVPLGSNAHLLVLIDEIEQYNNQIIVWAVYIHEIEAIGQVLQEAGINFGMVYGAIPGYMRAHILEQFALKKFKVLVAQPKAAGEGYNMSSAGKIVWFSQTPDAIVRSQANERATAVGKESVQIVDLVWPGGVNSYFLKLTTDKVKLADDVSRYGLKTVIENLKGA